MTAQPKLAPDRPPSAAQLCKSLGEALAAWDALLDPARKRSTEWKRYSRKDPWSLRVNEGKRTVLWLVPLEGELQVTVILGEKAVAAALAGSLSRPLEAALRGATDYPEGRAVRVRMKSAARVRDVERLVDFKLGRATRG